MTIEIMTNHSAKLIPVIDIRTRGHKMTSGQSLVEGGIISSVQLVDWHLPDIVRFTWTILRISVAFVRHSVQQGIGPDGNTTQGGSDRRIIQEILILHHVKLYISTNSEIGSSNTVHTSLGDVCESFDD